ncbi:MAG: hypothetical protein HY923_08500 [Elusimicrobia bacterium]|nr:hypothetical protein [Elusimicrobiota bacterium]
MAPPAVPCPRCDFPVEYEQDGCPRCQEERRNKIFARLKTLGCIFAVILALAAWQHRRILIAWQEFMVEVEYARYPALRKQRAQAADQAAFEAAEAAAAREVAQRAASVVVFTTVPVRSVPSAPAATAVTPEPRVAQEPAAPVENATPPPEPAPPGENHRRFYGVVYDASTLKPIAGAELKFMMTGAENGSRVMTDKFGHYQIDLVKFTSPDVQPNGSIALIPVAAPMVVAVTPVDGYRVGQLEDPDPPLRERSRTARRRIMEETSDGDLGPMPLRYRSNAVIVPLDLVLLPKRGKVSQ